LLLGGPKFSMYFPYNAKLCLNEYAKQQLGRKNIDLAAFDNGILRCDDPKRLRAIREGSPAGKIDTLLC
jgi:hypothetical protein